MSFYQTRTMLFVFGDGFTNERTRQMNDSDWVFLPDYEGEFSVMSRSEYKSLVGDNERFGEAVPAELVFNLDGSRGHYLAADFIAEAWAFLGSSVRMTREQAEIASAAKADADIYREHQSLGSTTPRCEPTCGSCEWISQDADKVEEILVDHGYVVEWNDGVYVYSTDKGEHR